MLRLTLPALALVALAMLTPAEATTQTVQFSQSIPFTSGTVTVSTMFTADTTAKTLTGTATVEVLNSTGGVLLSKTFTISLSFSSSNNINLLLNVPIGHLTLGVDCNVAIGSTPAATCTISALQTAGRLSTPSPT